MKQDEDLPAFRTPAEPMAPAASAAPAAGTAGAATAPAVGPRRRLRAWGLGLAALSLALAVLGFVAATSMLDGLQGAAQGLHIHIDGQEWSGAEAAAGPGGLLALGVVAALGLIALPVLLLLLSLVLVAAVLVPVGLVVMGVVGVVAAVVACVLLVGAVLLSPLWLAVLMLWWLLRRRDPVAAKSPAAPVAG